ncbi:hypothetical protein DSO57_1002448 [Entomophthora muscae]|uniref:Uncharacterized protein n=1 Tax=Entomophthora muscae TaxID=34485 RepID=A0ACC2RZX2_9FUNG|nr:hypothetical protein DSO57_1002448 [Entomophthora muscae]
MQYKASFSKKCLKFLAQASTPAYSQLIQLEKFANLEAAFISIMDQYKSAVENKLYEVVKNNSEWNPYPKKKEAAPTKTKVPDKVTKYVKAFLAQNVQQEWRGPPICYSCGIQGHILV